MDSKEYTQLAVRTESVPSQLIVNQRAFDNMLATIIEVGRIADLFKRRLYYGKPMSAAMLNSHCGVAIGQLQGLARLAGNLGNRVNERIDGDTGTSGNMDAVPIRLLHSALGIFTEAGEMFEALNVPYLGGQMDLVNFGEEVGDVEWYQAVGFDASGVDEDACRRKNIAKLLERFPERFDAENAVIRDLVAERKALEATT